MRKIWPFFFICTLIIAPFDELRADPRAELLKLPDRPTIQEFLAAFHDQLPDANPFQRANSEGELRQVITTAKSVAPILINNLERHFPNATWAALGRDAFFVGDVLDAYYLSLGETGRVRRIKLSSSSFNFLRSQQLIEYLEQLGLELFNDQAKPFIIFDRTNYTASSQMTQILEEIYRAYASRGRNAKQLLKRINGFSLQVADAWQDRRIPLQLDAEFFFLQILNSYKPDLGLYAPKTIGFMQTGLSDVSADSWTGSYGELRQNESGLYYTKPTYEIKDLDLKEHVLWEQFEILKLVRDPAFRKKAGRNLGLHPLNAAACDATFSDLNSFQPFL